MSPVQVDVRQRSVSITASKMGWTRDRFTKKLLRQWLNDQLRSSTAAAAKYTMHGSLDDAICDFSERIAAGAPTNIDTHFRRARVGYTMGGRPSSSRPLLYDPKRQLP